jgi:2-polyprenyl-3-methyl-5-hydroxy-6-metoxy-1,4-benzoquinol methylase
MVGKFTYKLRSEWSDYDPDSEYTAAKLQMVTELLTIPRCRVGDLGANTGRYTMTAERLGHDVIAIDRDHDCIEWLARQQLRSLPLVVDFCNPSPGIGWGNEEREAFLDRAEFDVTLALALVHHLCIGNNVPVDMVAEQLRRITKRTLLIEFVPETDPKAQILAQGRTFPEYSRDAFERAMSRHFVFEDKWQIGNSCRDLYMYHAG